MAVSWTEQPSQNLAMQDLCGKEAWLTDTLPAAFMGYHRHTRQCHGCMF